MADAKPDLPEGETTLRALLRSLSACLIMTRERAEKIACLDLDNYRGHRRDPDEDESLAQTAFDDDVDHAEEVLEWRATVVADLVGEAMSSYARAHSPLDDPWMAWRREPPVIPAAEFVHALTEEEIFCSRVAYHVHSDFDVRRPYSVPTDGDIEDIPEYLQTEQAWTWRDWLDLLGSPPITAYLALATVAAKYDLTEGHTRLNSEVGIRVTELSDQVAAFQMPTIERLERISAQVDALGAPSRFKAEEFLKDALGVEVYSSLSDDARTAALDAERRFRDRETLDWNSVIAELAKAFEIQVKQGFVPCLVEYLKKSGVMTFPDNELLPSGRTKEPIIKNGRALIWASLGSISIALGSTRPELLEFGRTHGLNLSELKKLIDDITRSRNRAAHETGMTYAEASRLRADWLGVTTRNGGIFGALLPKIP